eukprot:2123383-Alexandrium_andersonii.AAC.1
MHSAAHAYNHTPPREDVAVRCTQGKVEQALYSKGKGEREKGSSVWLKRSRLAPVSARTQRASPERRRRVARRPHP